MATMTKKPKPARLRQGSGGQAKETAAERAR
jgi:hypothetical protein